MLKLERLNVENRVRWQGFHDFFKRQDANTLERVKRIYPQGMYAIETLYGDEPLTIRELARQMRVSETHLKMLREQTLSLLGHEGPFSAQAKRGVERILAEYEARAKLAHVAKNFAPELTDLELAVIRTALKCGINPQRINGRLRIGESQVRTLLKRLAGQNDSIGNVPGRALRKSMLRALLRKGGPHAKAEVELACLREYSHRKNATLVGEELGIAGNVVTMLLAETVRDIESCSRFSEGVADLQRQSAAETNNTRLQTNYLYSRLYSLYRDFRNTHTLTRRELTLIRLRIAGKREKSVAEVLGIKKQDVSVVERAILGLLVPKPARTFPETLALAPFTEQQTLWLASVNPQG